MRSTWRWILARSGRWTLGVAFLAALLLAPALAAGTPCSARGSVAAGVAHGAGQGTSRWRHHGAPAMPCCAVVHRASATLQSWLPSPARAPGAAPQPLAAVDLRAAPRAPAARRVELPWRSYFARSLRILC